MIVRPRGGVRIGLGRGALLRPCATWSATAAASMASRGSSTIGLGSAMILIRSISSRLQHERRQVVRQQLDFVNDPLVQVLQRLGHKADATGVVARGIEPLADHRRV